MKLIYNFSIYVYAALIRGASVFNPQAKQFLTGRRGQFRKMKAAVGASDEIVWFHCASVGEFEQARPVIEAFRKSFHDYKILLTFFSPSGYELRKNYEMADYVFYLPLDKTANARKFINIFHPRLAIFIKYEYWFNYIDEIYKAGIPLYFVSAIFRKQQHFFRFYGGWFRKQLQKVSWFFVQNETSDKLLSQIGIQNHEISGDTRFDRVLKVLDSSFNLPEIELFKGKNDLLVAGSTWPPDEDILRSYMDEKPENFKLLLVPHKIDENHIEEILKKFEAFSPVRYSQSNDKDLADVRILVMDKMGLLSGLYRYATLAYIGGGFGVGIHNLLEAAVYGLPVIFGPNYQRFQEANDLLELGGGYSVKNAKKFQEVTDQLRHNSDSYKHASEVSKHYVRDNSGATEKVIRKISGNSPE
ncbi:MAG: 3-deoxy-D-manno-octulosonic acid transferase [Bacteroidales bacterium]|nr:3-deoxy-D-manno-octulosonic acid transferase [Bacteroidales bacterium]